MFLWDTKDGNRFNKFVHEKKGSIYLKDTLNFNISISFIILFFEIVRNYYYLDKGSRSYIGSWALSEDIDRFKKRQIAIRSSQLKSRE